MAQTPPNRPAILFTDVTAGPVTGGPKGLGAPIGIFGKGFGATRGSSKVTIGGVEVASYLTWGQQNANNSFLDLIVVQPGPRVPDGPLVVTVGGVNSTGSASFQRTAGGIYTLSPTGSDGAACTEAAPCRTLASVLGVKARAGDMVLLRGGQYNDGEIWIRDVLRMSGQPGRPVVIKNYPNEAPFYSNGIRPIILDASYVTISGLNLRNGKSVGVTGHDENNAATPKGASIINNTVVGPIDYDGIGVVGDGHTAAGNVVLVQSSTQGTQGHCFYISHGDGNRLLYNIADGAPGYGIHVFDQVRQRNDYRRVVSNLLVEGNIMRNSTERSGMILSMEDGGDWGTYGNYMQNVMVRNNVFWGNNHDGLIINGIVRGVRVYNNTFYENGRQGAFISEQPTVKDIDIRNNLIYQTENNPYCRNFCSWFPVAHLHDGLGDASRVRIDNNGYFPNAPVLLKGTSTLLPFGDAHRVIGPIGLWSAANQDFQLVAGSAAIDAGVALAEVPRDFNGALRPIGQKVDVGAFEFGSGPATNSSQGASAALTSPTTNPAPNPPPVPTACSDGQITSACVCGGTVRTDNFCCKGQWMSYDACKVATPPPPPAGTKACTNGPITVACVCEGQVRSDNFCCNGGWYSYDACAVPRK